MIEDREYHRAESSILRSESSGIVGKVNVIKDREYHPQGSSILGSESDGKGEKAGADGQHGLIGQNPGRRRCFAPLFRRES